MLLELILLIIELMLSRQRETTRNKRVSNPVKKGFSIEIHKMVWITEAMVNLIATRLTKTLKFISNC